MTSSGLTHAKETALTLLERQKQNCLTQSGNAQGIVASAGWVILGILGWHGKIPSHGFTIACHVIPLQCSLQVLVAFHT